MIPVLYDELDNLFPTPHDFPNKETIVKGNIPSHLVGYLVDTMSCKVTEERNGQYELILTYPVTGKLFDKIYPTQCIMVKPNQVDDPQLFRIYRTSKVLRGILTVYARHISYDLCGVDYDKNYALITPAPAPQAWINTFCLDSNFVGKSDIATTAQVYGDQHVFASVRSFLGGKEGSVLDTFGGEYLWDNFVVNLKSARGSNKGITIDYGKNMTEMTLTDDADTKYTAVTPFARYYNSSGEEVIKVGSSISTGYWGGYEWTKILDVTEMLGLESDEVPTNQDIADAANAWIADQTFGTVTLDVSTTEPSMLWYVTLGLCDTVKVRHPRMGVDQSMKVVGYEYDSLIEKYTKITLGKNAGNLAGTVNDIETAVATMKKEKTKFSSGSKSVDLAGGVITLYDGTHTTKLTAGIGERVHSDSSVSLSSGTTMQNLGDFTLTKGLWAISITVRFNSNATGRRAANLSNTSGGSAYNVRWGNTTAAVNGAYTYLHLSSSIDVTAASAQFYINAYQNSGSALTTAYAWDAVRVY